MLDQVFHASVNVDALQDPALQATETPCTRGLFESINGACWILVIAWTRNVRADDAGSLFRVNSTR